MGGSWEEGKAEMEERGRGRQQRGVGGMKGKGGEVVGSIYLERGEEESDDQNKVRRANMSKGFTQKSGRPRVWGVGGGGGGRVLPEGGLQSTPH